MLNDLLWQHLLRVPDRYYELYVCPDPRNPFLIDGKFEQEQYRAANRQRQSSTQQMWKRCADGQCIAVQTAAMPHGVQASDHCSPRYTTRWDELVSVRTVAARPGNTGFRLYPIDKIAGRQILVPNSKLGTALGADLIGYDWGQEKSP